MDRFPVAKWLPFKAGLIRAFSIDLRTLALFRILVGHIIIIDLLFRSQSFVAHYTDLGVLPRSVALQDFRQWNFSFYYISGDFFFSAFLFVLTGVFAVALIIGYKTHWVKIILWLLLSSLHARNPLILNGGDTLLRLLLFWSIFLPLGARFSVDAGLIENQPDQQNSYFSTATIAILMQAMYLYWVGALIKAPSPAWSSDFTAIYYALSVEQFVTHLGLWVRDHLGFMLPYLTRFVFYIELYGPLFMFAPFLLLWLRLPVLCLLIGMHVGFLVLIQVGHFPFVSIVSLLLFLPGECWNWLPYRRRPGSPKQMTLYYDSDYQYTLKIARILQNLLILPNIRILPAENDSYAFAELHDKRGGLCFKINDVYACQSLAYIRLIHASPLFFWLGWFLNQLHRHSRFNWPFTLKPLFQQQRLEQLLSRWLPWQNRPSKDSRMKQLLVGFLAVVTLVINLRSIDVIKGEWPEVLTALTQPFMGLNQRWSLFNNTPELPTRWPVIVGIQKNGKEVDAFRAIRETPKIAKPTTLSENFSYYRWRKFFTRLYTHKKKRHRFYYAMYLCRRWNKEVAITPEERLVRIDLQYRKVFSLPNPDEEVVESKSMGKYPCPIDAE